MSTYESDKIRNETLMKDYNLELTKIKVEKQEPGDNQDFFYLKL